MNANKVALITGANKGLGLEISRQLGQQGIAVVLGSRDLARGQAAADTLRAEGIDARAAQLDITNADDIAAVPAFLEQTFGRLDILVNNAGVLTEHQGITPEAFRQGYEANVIGPYFLTQALLPLLQAAPAGRIVNQSSILGSLATNASEQVTTDWLLPIYNSSKAALKYADRDPVPIAQEHAHQSQRRPSRLRADRHEPGGNSHHSPGRAKRRAAGNPPGRRPDRRVFPRWEAPALVTHSQDTGERAHAWPF